jgi:hypothetical protein
LLLIKISALLSKHYTSIAATITNNELTFNRAVDHDAVHVGNSVAHLLEGHAASQHDLRNLRDYLVNAGANAFDSDVAIFCALLFIFSVYDNFRIALFIATIPTIIRAIYRQHRALPTPIGFSPEDMILLTDALGDQIRLPIQLWETFDVSLR